MRRKTNIPNFGVVLCLLIVFASTSFAGSATWSSNPSSGDWNTASNWVPPTVPNGVSDTATFGSSSMTNVSLSADTQVGAIVFNAGASAFRITAKSSFSLTITGAGISNNSGVAQNLSAIGDQTSLPAGSLVFNNSATAGNATLSASSLSYDKPAKIQFLDNSKAGTASVVAYSNGELDISAHNAPRVRVGALAANGGRAFLGGNNLTAGRNGSSTTFAGNIVDDSIFGGAGGGSFTKVGNGTFTLAGASQYTGGTIVKAGTLLLKTGFHSAGLTGPVQVIRGTLGGNGAIFAYGDVTIGTGSSSGAKLLPGKSAKKPGTLEIADGTLTFNSLSTYGCILSRDAQKASLAEVSFGVTINSNVSFTFVDVSTGTLTPGTVFTIMHNHSGPIIGTFSNLPNGATFTSNGTTFTANYAGGDGNALTLTVQ